MPDRRAPAAARAAYHSGRRRLAASANAKHPKPSAEHDQHAHAPDAEVHRVDRDRGPQGGRRLIRGGRLRGDRERLHPEPVHGRADRDDRTADEQGGHGELRERLRERSHQPSGEQDEAADDQQDAADDREVDPGPRGIRGQRRDRGGRVAVGRVRVERVADQGQEAARQEQGGCQGLVMCASAR